MASAAYDELWRTTWGDMQHLVPVHRHIRKDLRVVSFPNVRAILDVGCGRKLEAAGLQVRQVRGWGFPFFSPLYRSLVEWLPGGPPAGSTKGVKRLAAQVLYKLYRLNWPGRADVLSVLAAVP